MHVTLIITVVPWVMHHLAELSWSCSGVVPCKAYGSTIGVLWKSRQNTSTSWEPHEGPMTALNFHGIPMGGPWDNYGFPMGALQLPWNSLWNTEVPWVSNEKNMEILRMEVLLEQSRTNPVVFP